MSEPQPGSRRRTVGSSSMGGLSGAALAHFVEFVDHAAEVSTLRGEVVYANSSFERLVGRHLGELLERAAIWCGDERVAAEGLSSVRAGVDWSGTLRCPDGDARTALLLPVRDADGQTSGCLTIIKHRANGSDVRATSRLNTLGRMAGGIAHDFNNMLGVISTYAELALRRTEPGDPVREAVLRIHEAAQRSSRLTRQLLVLSRGGESDAELLDVNATVFGLEELLRTMAGSGVRFATELSATAATVRLPRAQLEQVLLNLTANARDAMPRGGSLVLRTRNQRLDEDEARSLGGLPADNYVVIEVEDDGAGMSGEVASQVFEPFFTTKAQGGSGLGLSIIYSIVKTSGGHIALRSAPGKGATFSVYLPNRSSLVSSRPPLPFRRAPRVLVVDDEAPVRRAVSKLVGGAGFEVVVARDAGEALQILATDDVQVLLTDVVMPGMSGIALAEIVAERHPHVAVVYMSGYAYDVIMERGLDPSQMLYLQKPFTRLELLRKVEKAVGLRPDSSVAES